MLCSWCRRVVKKYVLYCCVVFFRVWNFVLYISVCIIFVWYIFCVWNLVLYISVCGISFYIFRRVEFRAVYFCVWNFVLYIFACEISSYIFPRVEFLCIFLRVWNFCVVFFRVWNVFVIFSLFLFSLCVLLYLPCLYLVPPHLFETIFDLFERFGFLE